MREIKFRGKDNFNGKWVYGTLTIREQIVPNWLDLSKLKDIKFYAILSREDECSSKYTSIPVFEDTIGQFTGLYDKNGKEVYENDIVEDCAGGKYIVEYQTNYMSFTLKQNKINWHIEGFKDYHNAMLDNMKVIGNKFDNPELLEEI